MAQCVMASIKQQEARFDRASFWSRLFNLWSFDIAWNARGRQFNLADLGTCPKHLDSEKLADKIELAWKAEQVKPKASFAWCSLRLFWRELIPVVGLTIIKQLCDNLLKPLMLANLLQYFTDPSAHDVRWAWLCCLGMIASRVLYILFHTPRTLYSDSWGTRMRVAWITMIYRKTLRLSNRAFQHTNAGQIVNLMSNDADTFDDFGYHIGHMISEPIITAIGTYYCYLLLGNVTFVGLAVVILLVPINYFGGNAIEDYEEKLREKTDRRVSVMTEIIRFMRTIKMYAWEKHFHNLISNARREEVNQNKKLQILSTIYYPLFELVSPLTLFAMFVMYALQGHSLNSHKVYTVITIFGSILFHMAWFFSDGMAFFFKIMTSSKRVQEYLMLEEIGENRGEVRNSAYHRIDTVNAYPIEVNNAAIRWQAHDSFTMDDISIRVKQGELLTVIGTVGSGKSTFLTSLLNEPSIVSGSVNIAGKVAYAAQEPWCFNDTIEANILFGQPYDKRKFRKVIEACALRVDLDSMPHREKTLVGERGVILSGGQKARVALARALYSDADIYLLDDPLSAVDAEVAKHIFEQCIEGYLRDKTVVLVTHQVQFIKNSAKILILNKGQPLAYGTYDHVLQSDSKLIDFIQKTVQEEDQEEKRNVDYKRQLSAVSDADEDYSEDIEPEEIITGAVSLETYRNYFKSVISWPVFLTAVGLLVASEQLMCNWSQLWLSQWTNNDDSKVDSDPTDVTYNSMIYLILIVGRLIFTISKWICLNWICLAASTNIHNRVFYALMRAPIAFLDRNPTGRILNRFTKDMDTLDDIADTFGKYITMTIEICATVVFISYFNFYLIIPAVIISIIGYFLRTFYANPSRELKRFESTLRSPVLSHTHLTLSGLTTIRAFQAENLLTEQFYYHQNNHSIGYFTYWCFFNLFGIVIDFLCQFYVFSVAVSLLLLKDIQSGTAGLILTMAFELFGPIEFAVRETAQLETKMSSAERLEEYTKLESEGPLETNYRLPENWPSSGRIEFDHVSLSYDGENDVLKDLTFEVRGGEKVSIVGRTGAGKSSVLAALFRMVEVKGRVAIDGVPSNALGLNQLRSALAIIPQEPMAFVGSVRANLDPLSCHSDGELWQALRSVQLASTVEQWEGQLDYELSEGGTNLSVGQRQLVCLARALLRGNQILVLDEATANVDHHTDQLIQGTIRECFAHCTVITIAHRLHTIIDSNRVLVLDAGRLVQFDTPRNLLATKTGIFYNLVQQTGPEMAAKLENAVFNAANQDDLIT